MGGGSRHGSSRREILEVAGAAAAGALLASAGCGPEPREAAPAPERPPAAGPVFDAHAHVGAGGGEDGVARLLEEMRRARVEGALVMASSEGEGGREEEETPLGAEALERIAAHLAPRGPLVPFAGVNPERAGAAALERTREAARRGLVRGLKIYLGYTRAWASDERYLPFYRLAADLGLPVMLHTGDTYSRTAHLKYAQPLTVDEVAVEFPSARFILAHLGNLWARNRSLRELNGPIRTLEAAEVVYKNANVFADLSGLVVADAAGFRSAESAEMLDDAVARIRQAFLYAEAPERFLYGSDWPLVPMPEYRALIARAIPEKHHAAVFRENARKLLGV